MNRGRRGGHFAAFVIAVSAAASVSAMPSVAAAPGASFDAQLVGTGFNDIQTEAALSVTPIGLQWSLLSDGPLPAFQDLSNATLSIHRQSVMYGATSEGSPVDHYRAFLLEEEPVLVDKVRLTSVNLTWASASPHVDVRFAETAQLDLEPSTAVRIGSKVSVQERHVGAEPGTDMSRTAASLGFGSLAEEAFPVQANERSLEGQLRAFLFNVIVENGEGDIWELTNRVNASRSVIVPGQGGLVVEDRWFAILEGTGNVTGARSVLVSSIGFAGPADLFLSGVTGSIDVSGARMSLEGQALHIQGRFDHAEATAGPQQTWVLQGEATFIGVDAATIAGERDFNLVIAAVAGTAVLALVWAWASGLLREALALLGRIGDPLGHENRAALYEAIRQQPGITRMQLAEATGISRTNVVHHVSMLRRADLVDEVRTGKIPCYVVNGGALDFELPEREAQGPPGAIHAHDWYAAQAHPVRREIMRVVPGAGMTLAEIKDRLHASSVTISQRQLRYNCRRLEEQGLLGRKTVGRRVHLLRLHEAPPA